MGVSKVGMSPRDAQRAVHPQETGSGPAFIELLFRFLGRNTISFWQAGESDETAYRDIWHLLPSRCASRGESPFYLTEYAPLTNEMFSGII